MSKRTQFRNDHKHRHLPKAIAELTSTTQTLVYGEPSRAKKRAMWANAFYGMHEWWKYIRLRNVLRSKAHKPHQGHKEMQRRAYNGRI